MPPDVTVAEETTTSVRLEAEEPKASGGLPITSWMVKYHQLDAKEHQKTEFFGTGKTLNNILLMTEKKMKHNC